jgi:hypothetical protein
VLLFVLCICTSHFSSFWLYISFDSCVVEINFSLFASFYNLYVPLLIEDFEVSSDFFGSSYLVN